MFTRFARPSRTTLAAIALLITPPALSAAPDTVDGVFAGSAGSAFVADDFGSVASIFVQPDGKILVGSNEMASTLGAGLQVPLLRFNPDGTVDETFFADTDANGQGQGIIFTGSGWPEVMALGLQSDGKIIAGGVMTGMNDGTNNVIGRSLVRINPDGTADPTFLNRGVSNWPTGGINYVEDLTVEPDDKILITGGFGGFVSAASVVTTRFGIARLHADGSLDTGFHIDPTQFGVPAGASLVRGIIYQAVRDSSGKYYIAGELLWNGGSVKVLARLFPNGQRDTGFNPSGLPNALWTAVTLAPDGRVLAIGQIDFQPSVMVALNPDGSPDPGFTLAPGLGAFTARPLQIDSSGRMLIHGQNSNWLKRLNADGSLDATFNATSDWNDPPTPSITTGYFNTEWVANNGKIYAGGGFDRVNSVETVKIVSFNGDPPTDGFRFDVTQQTVVENAGTAYIAVTRQGPAAAAGSLAYATANNTATAGTHYTATSGTLNWAAGESGTKYIALPILNNATADGDLTLSLNLSSPTGGVISGISSLPVTIVDDEGSPVIISHPQSIAVKQGFAATFSVAVSSPLPPTFQWFKDDVLMPGKTSPTLSLTNLGPDDAADYTVEVSVGGTPVPSNAATLTVIPPATVLDPNYNPSITESTAPVVYLTDGSLLAINGNFFSGYTVQKFNTDGTLATTWPLITTNASGGPLTLTPLPDGKFLASGLFTVINGVSRERIARLNADGTVDESFDAGLVGVATFSGPIVTPSGAIYIFWRPSSQGGGLVRLLENGATDPSFTSTLISNISGFLYSLVELPDGSLLVGYTSGSSFSFTSGLARLTSGGAAFPGFSAVSLNPAPRHLIPLPDGRIVVARNQILEIRFADGSLDPSFAMAGTLTGAVINSIAIQRGRIVVAGPNTFNGQAISGLARFSLTGAFDDNFPGGTGPTGGWATSFGAVGDNSLVVRGSFTAWNSTTRNRIAKLLLNLDEAGFEAPFAELLENGGPAIIRVLRYGNPSAAASLRVTSTNGSATSPTDFLAVDQTITWAPGDSSPKEVTLTPVDNVLPDGTRSLTLSLSEGDGLAAIAGGMNIAIIDDDSLPQITTQPENVIAINGQPASLSVSVTSPTAISYQWFLNDVLVSGATSATYPIASASSANEGVYTVRVTNDYDTIWSSPARLTIVPPPGAIASGFTPLAANIFNTSILALATAPDGGVYAGGAFTSVAGDANRNRLAKINANGSLDTGFTPPNISNGDVRSIAVQADGKVIAVGTFTTVGSVTRNRVVRLNPDGSLDTDFATAIGSASNGDVKVVAIEPSGTILLGGSISSWNGTSIGNTGLVRLSAEGSYLGTTNAIWPSTNGIQDILPLSNGNVLVSYDTTSSSHQKVRRLNASLTHDTSFVFGTSSNRRAENMALAADGDYLFAGNGGLLKVSADGTSVTSLSGFQTYDVLRQWNGKILQARSSNLSRLLVDGTTDPSFVVSTQPNGIVNRFAARGDGKVWVGGNFSTYNGTTVNRLFLLNSDVIPIAITRQPAALTLADPGSNVTLTVEASGISAISYQWFRNGSPIPGANGPNLVLENVTIANNGDYTCTVTNLQGSDTSQVAELIILDAPVILSQTTAPVEILEGGGFILTVNAIGVPTLSYEWRRNNVPLVNGPGVSGADGPTLTITNAPTTLAGSFTAVVTNSIDSATSTPVVVDVLENQAAMAPGFAPPTITGTVRQVYPLPGGKVLIGGDFTSASDGSNTSGARLAVVNADGSIEPVAGLSADGPVYAIRDGGDGKILIAGNFNLVNGEIRRRVARLNANLSLDLDFDASTGFGQFGGLALDVAREASGTIMVAGQFGDFNADPAADYVVRLTATGAHDTSFTSTANSFVNRVFPQADGKVVLAGWFSTWSGNAAGRYLVRTLSDGSRDDSLAFATGSFDSLNDAHDLGDGRFLAAPGFLGAAHLYDVTGAKNAAFLSQGQPNAQVSAFAVDASGRILVGGNFTTIAGASHNRIVRITPEGLRDDTFAIGTGLDGIVEDILVAPDGSIWVGGNFTSYNGIPVQRLVRLKGTSGAAADPIDEYYITAGLPENLRGDTDDGDGNGVPNLVEYLYQTNPANAAEMPQPFTGSTVMTGAAIVPELDQEKSYRVIQVELPKNLRGLTVEIQVSTGLDTFGTGPGTATEFGVPVDQGDTEIRSYYLTPAQEDAETLFWRMAVSR
jgi:uncharacterized delta-60 repeat protein